LFAVVTNAEYKLTLQRTEMDIEETFLWGQTKISFIFSFNHIKISLYNFSFMRVSTKQFAQCLSYKA